MPKFLNTLGRSIIGIAICDRCKFKAPTEDLIPDPNSPGLRVHQHCADQFDPWRLPALQDDRMILPFVRPDLPLTGVSPPVDYTQKILVFQNDNPQTTEDNRQLATSP